MFSTRLVKTNYNFFFQFFINKCGGKGSGVGCVHLRAKIQNTKNSKRSGKMLESTLGY